MIALPRAAFAVALLALAAHAEIIERMGAASSRPSAPKQFQKKLIGFFGPKLRKNNNLKRFRCLNAKPKRFRLTGALLIGAMTFGGHSLFDRDVQMVEGFPEPGRTFHISPQVRF